MASQRSTLRTHVKFRMGNRTDLTNAQLDEWLNAGMLGLASRIHIQNLDTQDTSKTFTVGANTVAMPTTLVAVLDIRNSTRDEPLEPMEWSVYRKMKVTSGTPRQWAVWGKTLYFDRKATAADTLDMFGVAVPTATGAASTATTWGTGDTARPPVDDQLEYGIELLAALHGFRDIGAEAKARLIEDPNNPGVGQFWTWVRANKLPVILQGMAIQSRPTTIVQGMIGYSMIE